MLLSVITPHYNDLNGLTQVYECLLSQTQVQWQWVIVDDLSDSDICKKLEAWHFETEDKRVKLIFNSYKSNASVCRNIGADSAVYDNLVFLDSDDIISTNFLSNRQLEFNDFVVLKNTAIIDQTNKIQLSPKVTGPYLDYFLQARFIWPITAIVWNKHFFNSIGQFNAKLPRLQDVELAIRAMQNSENYIVVDNEVDFYYNVKPIRSRKNFLKPVCDATYIFMNQLLQTQHLTKNQVSLLRGYYFMNTKYLERSESRKEASLVHRNLLLFYKKGYIGLMNYIFGLAVLKLFVWNILSPNLFLRINRRIFKPSIK